MSSGPRGDEWESASAFLAGSVLPLRLAVADTQGRPRIVSLWYEWDGTSAWCATQGRSRLASYVARSGACSFEVSTNHAPYVGVRGTASAIVSGDGAPVLERLLDRYGVALDSSFAKWLLSRSANEVAIQVTPSRMSHWDYSSRMSSDTGMSG